jgi:hypothetical protein
MMLSNKGTTLIRSLYRMRKCEGERYGDRLEHRLERTWAVDASVCLELAGESGRVFRVEREAGPDAPSHAFLLFLDGVNVALFLEDLACTRGNGKGWEDVSVAKFEG